MKNRASLSSFSFVEDRLLAGIAARIQLSPTNHQRAVDRYKAINEYLDRDSGVLAGRIESFYPQGSMAIGSTIASRLSTDNFDLDIIAQLTLAPETDPKDALYLLFQAIRGEPGSRYYSMVERKSRCMTVTYEDGMHVDITPMVRRLATAERESVLFHYNHEKPHLPRFHKVANPFGFANWFRGKTPQEVVFAEEYALLAKNVRIFADAEQDPIPEQDDLYRKSMAVIALQLLKRFRNVRYDRRDMRRPPSVMMSKLAADSAGQSESLSDELLHQARKMHAIISESMCAGQLVQVVNPLCGHDVFTDRWPETQSDQSLFVGDLEYLIERLTRLKSGCSLDEMQKILIDLFGEKPTLDSLKVLGSALGQTIRSNSNTYIPGSKAAAGGAALVGLGSASTSAAARATPPHRFFGD